MNAEQAIEFVRTQGVVLVAGKGPVPRLVEAIAGEPIQGSWWAHSKSHQIFATLQKVTDSTDVLVCRLVEGKVTLVHRRLWPALVRLAPRFPPERLAQIHEQHTESGRHVTTAIAFPQWVPADIKAEAMALSQEDALAQLGLWTQTPSGARRTVRRPRRSR